MLFSSVIKTTLKLCKALLALGHQRSVYTSIMHTDYSTVYAVHKFEGKVADSLQARVLGAVVPYTFSEP